MWLLPGNHWLPGSATLMIGQGIARPPPRGLPKTWIRCECSWRGELPAGIECPVVPGHSRAATVITEAANIEDWNRTGGKIGGNLREAC